LETLEAIRTRRSIRKYTETPVSDDAIKTLLEAAMAAPSAGNEQPWHFIVIRDRKTLEQIGTEHRYAQMAKDAQAVIVVCGDETLEQYEGLWIQDCSAATQTLLLAARAQGLGAVWCGVYPAEDRVSAIQKLLALPEHVIPLCLVPIGHPAEEKPPAERYNPARVHDERWE
jgi:nitroreductase